jgi:hypothetical protein
VKQPPSADLARELSKAVIEAVDKYAETQRLDDEEHVVRMRSLIEALRGTLERGQIDEIDPWSSRRSCGPLHGSCLRRDAEGFEQRMAYP